MTAPLQSVKSMLNLKINPKTTQPTPTTTAANPTPTTTTSNPTPVSMAAEQTAHNPTTTTSNPTPASAVAEQTAHNFRQQQACTSQICQLWRRQIEVLLHNKHKGQQYAEAVGLAVALAFADETGALVDYMAAYKEAFAVYSVGDFRRVRQVMATACSNFILLCLEWVQ